MAMRRFSNQDKMIRIGLKDSPDRLVSKSISYDRFCFELKIRLGKARRIEYFPFFEIFGHFFPNFLGTTAQNHFRFLLISKLDTNKDILLLRRQTSKNYSFQTQIYSEKA